MGLFSKADDEQVDFVTVNNIQAEAYLIAKQLEQEANDEAERIIALERKTLEHKHKHELALAEERRIIAMKNTEIEKEIKESTVHNRIIEQLIQHASISISDAKSVINCIKNELITDLVILY